MHRAGSHPWLDHSDVCARDPFSENGLQQLFRLNLGAKFVMLA